MHEYFFFWLKITEKVFKYLTLLLNCAQYVHGREITRLGITSTCSSVMINQHSIWNWAPSLSLLYSICHKRCVLQAGHSQWSLLTHEMKIQFRGQRCTDQLSINHCPLKQVWLGLLQPLHSGFSSFLLINSPSNVYNLQKKSRCPKCKSGCSMFHQTLHRGGSKRRRSAHHCCPFSCIWSRHDFYTHMMAPLDVLSKHQGSECTVRKHIPCTRPESSIDSVQAAV